MSWFSRPQLYNVVDRGAISLTPKDVTAAPQPLRQYTWGTVYWYVARQSTLREPLTLIRRLYLRECGGSNVSGTTRCCNYGQLLIFHIRLFGIASLQVFIYFSRYPKDSPWFKTFVSTLLHLHHFIGPSSREDIDRWPMVCGTYE